MNAQIAICLTTALLLCLRTFPAMADPKVDKAAQKAWDAVREDLDKVAKRLEKRQKLPDASFWHPVREDRDDNDRKINRLMDEALSHLRIARITDFRKAYSELDRTIAAKRKAVTESMERKVGAPEETGGVSALWTMTRKDYDERIAKCREAIAECEKRQQEIVVRMQKEMTRIGVPVSSEQMEALLLVVSGDSFLELSACFHNVRQLTAVVANLIQDNEAYVENSRRYYGMYVSLVKILMHAHDRARNDIRRKYLPEIDRITSDAERTMADTKALLSHHADEPDTVERLKQNLAAQRVVLEAGGSYRAHLKAQAAKLEEAEQMLRRHYEIALNTFETVNLASGMLTVVRKSLEDFQTLQGMQLPEMLPLEAANVREQFERISEQIRE